MRRLELLAPAKNIDVAMAAINCGADAVYIGAEGFGARSAACNSIADIAAVVDYAHRFNVRVYVTFNTLIYDNELKQAEEMIKRLYCAGVDALIIQDLGILRMDIPPIELHASTQCDMRTPDKAMFFESLGFSQIVLARELNIEEIRAIRNKINVRLEAFVHGALCVSYSGRCQVSQVLKGRSANRGECAQICRLPFDLVDSNGKVIVENKHLLSLKDFNLSSRMRDLVEAGVDAFKIEGRLKDINYVKNVTAYYRHILDNIIAEAPEAYCGASGHVNLDFSPDLNKSFNRGFTHYYFDERNLGNGYKIASIDTPKSMGERVGTVKKCMGRSVTVSSKTQFNNGDGISYFNADGTYSGFRVNRVDGNMLVLPKAVNIPSGTVLYRTYDKQFDDRLNVSKTERKILVDFVLRTANGNLVLDATDERGNRVTCSVMANIEPSSSSQDERQRETLLKTGNTIYAARNVVTIGDKFVPQSILSRLRRAVLEALDRSQLCRYEYGYRKHEDASAKCFSNQLNYADNVANHLSETLYREHGVTDVEPALEVLRRHVPGTTVMHTRYCLRRELGICRKSDAGREIQADLYLRHGDIKLALEFDCKNCEMLVKTVD